MPICLVVQPIHPSGIQKLQAAGIEVRKASAADMQVVAREIADCDAVITRNAGLDTAAINAAARLQVIANHGVGTNKIDVARATQLNIPIVFTPYANARSVAEHAIALMLAVGKRLVNCDQAVRGGHWDYRYESGLQELHGKVLGVVGFGTIGRLTAEIAARGFGMKVLVHSPSARAEHASKGEFQFCDSLEELLKVSDVVSLHRPARPDTRHLINRQTLASMKPSSILINTARAELIDTAALAQALTEGQIAGAGIDVFDHEPVPAGHILAQLSNVVLTPHSAGSTDEALQAAADQCADQIIDILAQRRPTYIVNPAVWDQRRIF